MSKWGTSYLELDIPKKPLTALSSHEGNREEYYAQPQDMPSYRDRFAEVQNKGSGNGGLRDGGGLAQLWVFRVVHLTDITLASFIRRQGIEVLDVQQVSHKEAAYKSFLVTVYEKDAPALLHSSFWPGLVSCKYWHEQEAVSRGSILSRRSSAKSKRKMQQEKYARKDPPQQKAPAEKSEPRPKENKSQRWLNPEGGGQGQSNRSSKKGRSSVTRVISSKGKRNNDVRKRDDNDRQRREMNNNNNSKNTLRNKNESDKRDNTKESKRNNSNNDHGGKSDKNRGRKNQEEKSIGGRHSREKERKQVVDKDEGKKRTRDDDGRKGKLDKDEEDVNKYHASKRNKDNGSDTKEKKYTVGKDDKHKNVKSRNKDKVDKDDKRKSGKARDKYVDDKDNKYESDKGRDRYTNDTDSGKTRDKNIAGNQLRGVNGENQVGDKNKDSRQANSDIVKKKQVSNRETDKRYIGEKDKGSRHKEIDERKNQSRTQQNKEKDEGRGGHLLPEIPKNNPSLSSNSRANSEEKDVPGSPRYSTTLPSIDSARDGQREASVGSSSRKDNNWVMSLSGLLILSSEEVVLKLLGPDLDGLLSQDVISDDELFLGVKVLAHASRAKINRELLDQLVYKIWQPHVIHLIKTFTVTVERLYPERAERYFWDLAEFLDLYVSGNIHIEKMPNLINTCLMEVLALRYKNYVSEDIVKVFRVMQSRVGKTTDY